MRGLCIFVLVLTLLVPEPAMAARKRKRSRSYPAAVSALVWDATANQRLYAKNIDRKVFPASTTKVMTALLALERLPLDKYVTVSKAAVNVVETKLGARPGEQYQVRDLIYATLLKSANDAANILAEAVAGSQEKFVDLMNHRAASLGARTTRFGNAHGLPSGAEQYTTARDMAVIFAAAMQKPFFRQALAYKHRTMYSKEGRRFFLKSHNKCLFLDWKAPVYGKTGYTGQAGPCFVGYFSRDKRVYIVNVFNSRRRWDDVKYLSERYGGIDL